MFIDDIAAWSVTLFEELLFDADPAQPLHVLLHSMGGDGETAIRLARAAQSRCSELAIIVPDQAKSAATIMTLGAHEILMSATSDLGPIDPQLRIGTEFIAARDIIAAAERATKAVETAPDTYPIWAAMLADLNAIIVQRAQAAVDRSEEQLREALSVTTGRTSETVESLVQSLSPRLISGPKSHAAVFGADEAAKLGLPVAFLEPTSEQWRHIWELWTRYFALGQVRVYESRRASQVMPVGG